MHAEVGRIRQRMLNDPWPQFLRSLVIDRLRGWAGQEVRFDFPLAVVAGENGSGKSTILKAAACAYANPNAARTFYPSAFFPDTAWDQSTDVSIRYRIRQGQNELEYSLTKPAQRWRRMGNRPRRNVVWQDISRTLPIAAAAGYAAIAKRTAIEAASADLNADFLLKFSEVLGRNYQAARMATVAAHPGRLVGVVRAGGQQFSQFHQGAGEDASLDLMTLLQNVANHSLILVDEVEASLHPRSQRRLIHFLLWLCRTRQIQVICSTHSAYVLSEVPLEGRIFVSRGAAGISVLYGVSPDFALNRMDDPEHPQVFALTEDREATVVVREILRHTGQELAAVGFSDVGPANVVRILGQLSEQNRLPFRAVCVQDADQPAAPGCVSLPGNMAPERQVFTDVLANAVNHLAVALDIGEPVVTDALNGAVAINDHHEWLVHASQALNVPVDYLWMTMVRVWVRQTVPAAQMQPLRDAVQAALQ